MRARRVAATWNRGFAAAVVVGVVAAGCSSGGDEAATPSTTSTVSAQSTTTVAESPATTAGPAEAADAASHADTVATLLALLPPDVRSVSAVDVAAVTAAQVGTEPDRSIDPIVGEIIDDIATLAGPAVAVETIGSAVVAQTSGSEVLLLASVADPPSIESDARITRAPLLADSVIAAGSAATVEAAIIAAADNGAAGDSTEDDTAFSPFVAAISGDHDISLAHALVALDADVPTDRTLRSAVAMTATFDVVEGNLDGSFAFHHPDAAGFVEAFNALNRPSTEGEAPAESPLTVGESVVAGFETIAATMPPTPLFATHEEARLSRNLAKKLIAGMEAFEYAEGVADPGNAPWLDFVVRSEADTPASPGSVYIRWEFRDDAARQAFEENELPEGFRLAPTSFLESDDPEGEYFFALNLYNAAGGSIVSGARAEWDVFVHPPEGADPNAGERPRFMVVDVLAEEVSADPGNLLTTAQPLSHSIVGDDVVSTVQRTDDDGEAIDVFSSSFPIPDPAVAEVARFTREMAIGNDYIYWDHGVSDRVLYNATTFNHDAYFVDVDAAEFVHNTRWTEYLAPEVKDAVYYVNDLEYVASPMANLDSEFLDLTPEWLGALVEFKTNGHQRGLMRTAVEQLFRGAADPFVGEFISNDTPATYYNFEITDPAALGAMLDLPPGHQLAPTTLFVDGDEAHYLTLAVYEIDGAIEGTRAEWIVYTDKGDGRPPGMVIVDLLTEGAAFDPMTIVSPPSAIGHSLDGDTLRTSLSAIGIEFGAVIDVADSAVSERELSLDWIEAGDIVCSLNDICDNHYYDAETLDVPVSVAADVSIETISAPWLDAVNPTSVVVFWRDNAQEYAVQHWFDLDVPFEEVPFSGLENRTHSISGSGGLTGRSNPIVNSEYTYTGDAVVEDGQVTFAIDQQIDNALGEAHIFTTGVFDLTTGTGTQTVIDCLGAALLCSDVENGSTAFYVAEGVGVDADGLISWEVTALVELGGGFGVADSASSFAAAPAG